MELHQAFLAATYQGWLVEELGPPPVSGFSATWQGTGILKFLKMNLVNHSGCAWFVGLICLSPRSFIPRHWLMLQAQTLPTS